MVAADARQRTVGPDDTGQASGDRENDTIANHESEGAVDGPEPVDIDHEHGDLARHAGGEWPECAGQTVEEQLPVGQRRQAVVDGVVQQALLGTFLVGGVADKAHTAQIAAVGRRHARPFELQPSVRAVGVPQTNATVQRAAVALPDGEQLEAKTLAVSGMHVCEKIVDRGRQLPRSEAQRRFDPGVEAKLVAADIPFPEGDARAIERDQSHLLAAGARGQQRLARPKGVLGHCEAEQQQDEDEPRHEARDRKIAGKPSCQCDCCPEQPNQEQDPGRHDGKCTIEAPQGQHEDQQEAETADQAEGKACHRRCQAGIENGYADDGELGRNPDHEQCAREPTPQVHPQEGRQEDDEARSQCRLGRRPVLRIVLRLHLEELVPEAEVHAQQPQRTPGDEPRHREYRLVVGREHRGQEHRQQARDPEHDAIEELALALPLLELDGLPEIDARKALGCELDDVGDRLPALDGQAKNVGAIVPDPLRSETGRLGYRGDPAGIEIWPDDASADCRVAVRREPQLQGLVGRVREREYNPIGTRAWGRSPNTHPGSRPVRARRHLDLERIAPSFVRLAESGDVEPVLLARQRDGLQRLRRRDLKEKNGEQHKKRTPGADARSDTAHVGAAKCSRIADAQLSHATRPSPAARAGSGAAPSVSCLALAWTHSRPGAGPMSLSATRIAMPAGGSSRSRASRT